VTEVTTTEVELNTGTPLWALQDLPPFPAVATQLLSLLSTEEIALDDVSRLIASDPVFAADVLQIANSALFSLQCEVKSVSHAIVVLGLERVKGISLTRALGNYMSPTLKVQALRRCWTHSLAGAILAEKLARTAGLATEVAYTAGLLRDIGRLAMLVKYPESYANMLIVTQENDFDLLATERDLFEIDHCQAGCWLTAKMQITKELRDVVAHHHDAQEGGAFGLVQLVRAADLLAESLGFGALNDPEPTPFADNLKEIPEAVRNCFQEGAENLKMEIEGRMRVLTPAAR